MESTINEVVKEKNEKFSREPRFQKLFRVPYPATPLLKIFFLEKK